MSGRVGRIRKNVLPQFDVGFQGEFEVSEKVLSCSMNPRLGGEAAGFESTWLVAKEADDEIEHLWGEGGRHRGLPDSWCIERFLRSRE